MCEVFELVHLKFFPENVHVSRHLHSYTQFGCTALHTFAAQAELWDVLDGCHCVSLKLAESMDDVFSDRFHHLISLGSVGWLPFCFH